MMSFLTISTMDRFCHGSCDGSCKALPTGWSSNLKWFFRWLMRARDGLDVGMWEGSCDGCSNVGCWDGSEDFFRRPLRRFLRRACCRTLTGFMRWLLRGFLRWIRFEKSCDVVRDGSYDGSNLRWLLRSLLQKIFGRVGCRNLRFYASILDMGLDVGIWEGAFVSSYVGSSNGAEDICDGSCNCSFERSCDGPNVRI